MNDLLIHISWRYVLLFLGTGVTLWWARFHLRSETSRIVMGGALASITTLALTDLSGLFGNPVDYTAFVAFSALLILLSFVAQALLQPVSNRR